MITKKDLLERIFNLECVIELLTQRVSDCERVIEKKKARKND